MRFAGSQLTGVLGPDELLKLDGLSIRLPGPIKLFALLHCLGEVGIPARIHQLNRPTLGLLSLWILTRLGVGRGQRVQNDGVLISR